MHQTKNPLSGIFEEYQSLHKGIFFFMVCLITFLLLFIKKNFIESEIAAFEILQERGQMGFYHMVNALQYFSIPLVYLIKFTITAFIIWIGCFMFGYRVLYSQIWYLVMLGECIFFVAEIFKIIWFLVVFTDPEIWDIRAFYPLSLMNLVNFREIPDSWHYPLKALNIFEVFYWIFLVYGIHYLSKKRLDISWYIILTSYVFWFLVWLGFYLIVYK